MGVGIFYWIVSENWCILGTGCAFIGMICVFTGIWYVGTASLM